MNWKFLVITKTIYPWPSGSAAIINNFAAGFDKEEMILVGQKHASRSEEGWPENYPKLFYIKPPDLRLINGRGEKYFKWLKFFSAVNYVKNLVKKHRCNIVFGIYPDEFHVAVGLRVAKKLNLPFITWFHNTYLEEQNGQKRQIANYLQPRIFKNAKLIFTMSKGLTDFYKKNYPNHEFHTLKHGFQIPEFPKASNRSIDTEKVRFLFSGSLNESCRDATVRLFKAIQKVANWELHIYSGNPESDFLKHGISGPNVFFHGFVNLTDLEEQFENFDFMLLPHGFRGKRSDVEYQTIFPTRTIPLLYSGKPIIAHSPDGVFLTEFLEENKAAFTIKEEDEFVIQEKIDQLLNDKNRREDLVENAFETAKQFDIKKNKQCFLDTIESKLDPLNE